MPVRPLRADDARLVEEALEQAKPSHPSDLLDFLGVPDKARYKIEVVISGDRVSWKPWRGLLTVWESGAMLHGGGDVLIYQCPGKHLKQNTCEAFIPSSTSFGDGWICPTCKCGWDSSQVIGQVAFNLVPQKWAEVLHTYYHRLGCSADLVISYMPQKLRTATEREQAKQLGGEVLNTVREQRTRLVYPLAHLIKDTSAGAGLYDRILAFLRAS